MSAPPPGPWARAIAVLVLCALLALFLVAVIAACAALLRWIG